MVCERITDALWTNWATMTVSRRNAVTRSELPASSQLPRARRDSLTRVAMRPVQRTDGVAAGGRRPVEGERKVNGRPCAGRSPAPCYPTQLHPTLTAPRRAVPQAKGASVVTGDDDDGHTHPASGVPGASQAHHQARRNGDTFPRGDASLRSVSHRRLGGLADKSRTSPSPAMLGEDHAGGRPVVTHLHAGTGSICSSPRAAPLPSPPPFNSYVLARLRGDRVCSSLALGRCFVFSLGRGPQGDYFGAYGYTSAGMLCCRSRPGSALCPRHRKVPVIWRPNNLCVTTVPILGLPVHAVCPSAGRNAGRAACHGQRRHRLTPFAMTLRHWSLG